MKFVFFLLFITLQVKAIDDFWVIWRYKAETRCEELGETESNCELICDIIEEQFMETAYPLYTKICHCQR